MEKASYQAMQTAAEQQAAIAEQPSDVGVPMDVDVPRASECGSKRKAEEALPVEYKKARTGRWISTHHIHISKAHV